MYAYNILHTGEVSIILLIAFLHVNDDYKTVRYSKLWRHIIILKWRKISFLIFGFQMMHTTMDTTGYTTAQWRN